MGASDAPSSSAAGSESRDPTLEIWGVKVPLPHWAMNVVAGIIIVALVVFIIIHLRQDASEQAQTGRQMNQLKTDNDTLKSQLAERYTLSGVVEANTGSVDGLPVYAASPWNLDVGGNFRFENMLKESYTFALLGDDKKLYRFTIGPEQSNEDCPGTSQGKFLEACGAGFTIKYKYDKKE